MNQALKEHLETVRRIQKNIIKRKMEEQKVVKKGA
jgi:hypothetical protein